MDLRSVKKRHRRIAGLDQQGDFGAAEDDAFRALLDQAADHLDISRE